LTYDYWSTPDIFTLTNVFEDGSFPRLNNFSLINDSHTVEPDLYTVLGLFNAFNFTNWQHVKNVSLNHESHPVEPNLLRLDTVLGLFDAFDFTIWQQLSGAGPCNETSGGCPTTFYQPPFNPFTWACPFNDTIGSFCTNNKALRHVDDWTIGPERWPIDHCLSQKVPKEGCKLEYSLTILLIIIGCDLLKIAVVFVMLRFLKESPCVTLGDSIAHFLRNPDKSTYERCLMDQRRTVPSFASFVMLNTEETEDISVRGTFSAQRQPRPVAWLPASKRWHQSPAPGRWIWVIVL
jgi:hypothetical protein